MKHWPETVARYLKEERTVSGGDNPPDKPGYLVKTLSDVDTDATAELEATRAAGYELLFALPASGMSTRVILSNYKK